MSKDPAPTGSPSADEGEGGHGVGLIAAVAAMGGFLFGYDSSVINGAVDAIQFHFHVHSSFLLGFAVAIALLGAAVGAVFAGQWADRWGRLLVMRVAALLFLIAAIGTAVAPDLITLMVFRVIGGLGIGVASVIAPTYIAEVSPARIRGRLASLQQLAIVFGIFAALLVDYAFYLGGGHCAAPDIPKHGSVHCAIASSGEIASIPAWRWMFLAMLVPAVIYGGLSLTIPESPRYLLAAGKDTRAREVLERVLGLRGEALVVKVNSIKDSLKREKPPAWSDLRGPALGLLPIVWIGLLLSVFQQFVGINVIFYFSTVLWSAVGFSSNDSFVISVISSLINIAATFIAIAFVDKVGRKPLLLIGSAGMTVTLGTMAVIFGTANVTNGQPHLSGAAGPIALVAANLFVVAFALSWGPVVWVLLGELFPNRIRASGLAVAAGAQWIANFAITETFSPLKDLSLGVAYGLYALFALLSFVFVSRWVRETKGMELEDMDDQLRVSS
ncbi:sugar porter family MFS transporter [Flexivirga caeni]|uniref:MFS transporter n=1 Tax=Flexivirga caeni TaxID=2294115 RepID=A0A3M9MFE5_9MICO|nr:sugar porter family MFS transporter [Flexivirga caeni]RNI24271.1 MFS transporter [Flexivirga caeni]